MRRWANILVVVAFSLAVVLCSRRPETVTFLDHQNTGDAAFVKKDYVNAEKEYKAALADAEKRNPDSPLIRIALDSLATNYMAWGKYAEAEATYKREIEIVEKQQGTESAEMLSALENMTWLYLKQQRFGEADILNKKALAIVNSLSPDKHRADLSVLESQREAIEQHKK